MASILVVEDDFNMRLLITTILERAGHEVQNVENGKQALESLRRSCHYDLIISDILMAEMNGLELLGWVRQLCPSIPVMMLSVHSRPDWVQEALENGAVVYLLKPFTKGQLTTIVEKILGSSQAAKDDGERTGSLSVGTVLRPTGNGFASLLMWNLLYEDKSGFSFSGLPER